MPDHHRRGARALWAVFVLLMLMPACAPDRPQWQVAITSATGSFGDGGLTLARPDTWSAGRSQDAAVAGVVSTQRLISTWRQFVGPDPVEAVLLTGERSHAVRVDNPTVDDSGALRFAAEAGSLPSRWGPGVLVFTIQQSLRDSVALTSQGWSVSLTTGAGMSTPDGRVTASPMAAVAVALDGSRARLVDRVAFVDALPARQGFLITLVNRTTSATRFEATRARSRGDGLRLQVMTPGGLPPMFNNAALLMDDGVADP